jgi:type I restriction enzyme S subunit
MSSEWIDTTIGDQVQLQRGVDITKRDFKQGTIPVVSSGGIGGFHDTFTGVAPGVILGRKGLVGSVYYLPTDYWAHDTTLWVKDFKGNHPKYVYYFFRSIAATLRDLDVGSANPTLNRNHVHPIETRWAPIAEQKAIAHILGTLDDKIELNRKTNETLEAMAKALFKSWFVDFDPVRAKAEGRSTGLPAEISDLFPDSFEDSELGEIPRGWQCCSFTKLVDVISGGTPKTSINEYWNGSMPWFSVVDAPPGSGCWAIQTEKRITPEGLANCSSKLLPTGTTIISARGTVGKVCLAGRDMAMNQSCYGLRSKAENGEFFCFYLTKSLVEILEARAHGSVFSTITRDTLDGVATISPSLEAIQSFNRSTGALLGKIKANLEENRILGNQRDALLPKLICGELRIPDAEKMLEEAGL